MAQDRLAAAFTRLREGGRKAFVAYLCAGDPHLDATVECVVALAEAGVDVVELGFPYSDPMADGPAIQAACDRALRAGATVAKVLAAVHRIRERTQVPIVAFTYANPVLAYGPERFAADAAAAGIDGVLPLDLPPEEGPEILAALRGAGLATVCLVAPTTTQERRRLLGAATGGFLYYICRMGTTGERADLPEDLAEQVAALRAATPAPVCIGFGISSPEQAAAAARQGDGVVVGSHLVRLIERHAADPALPRLLRERAAAIAAAVHAA
ncbi:MAG: hypothetical protein RLZZ127_2268 [Planctomycetota bacterium]|jgi:tryptophan synthase alpha chain